MVIPKRNGHPGGPPYGLLVQLFPGHVGGPSVDTHWCAWLRHDVEVHVAHSCVIALQFGVCRQRWFWAANWRISSSFHWGAGRRGGWGTEEEGAGEER